MTSLQCNGRIYERATGNGHDVERDLPPTMLFDVEPFFKSVHCAASSSQADETHVSPPGLLSNRLIIARRFISSILQSPIGFKVGIATAFIRSNACSSLDFGFSPSIGARGSHFVLAPSCKNHVNMGIVYSREACYSWNAHLELIRIKDALQIGKVTIRLPCSVNDIVCVAKVPTALILSVGLVWYLCVEQSLEECFVLVVFGVEEVTCRQQGC